MAEEGQQPREERKRCAGRCRVVCWCCQSIPRSSSQRDGLQLYVPGLLVSPWHCPDHHGSTQSY